MFIRKIMSTMAIGLFLFVTFAVLIVPTPSVMAVDEGAVVTDTHMVPVAIHMTEGYELSPEPATPDDMEQSAACPNGYVGEGLFGFGYLKRFGHVYPRYVGTWATKELQDTLVVVSQSKFVGDVGKENVVHARMLKVVHRRCQ